MIEPKRDYMEAAIRAAKDSRLAGDYAVGAAIVYEAQILVPRGEILIPNHAFIVTSGNSTHLNQDTSQHAEVNVIRLAQRYVEKDLSRCVLYSTHEPCPMCAGAVFWSKLGGVVYGATLEDHKRFSEQSGNSTWKWRTMDVEATTVLKDMEKQGNLVGGFMRPECLELFHS